MYFFFQFITEDRKGTACALLLSIILSTIVNKTKQLQCYKVNMKYFSNQKQDNKYHMKRLCYNKLNEYNTHGERQSIYES